jgi:hypothetical protein
MKAARVAAHVHSSWSYDAQWSLPDIARAFRRHRYDAVLMAEHDRSFDEHKWADYRLACQEASTGGILLVPGIEYEDSDGVVHVPVWGEAVPFLGAGRPTLDLLRSARDQNAIAVLAHPWRRNAISRYQPEWGGLLSDIEIWNRKYDGVAPSRPLRRFADREGVAPFVSLDFHTRRQFFPLAMSLTLAAEPSTVSLVEAIRNGHGRPEFLGVSALRGTEGITGAALRALELARRGARRPVHRRSQRAGSARMITQDRELRR